MANLASPRGQNEVKTVVKTTVERELKFQDKPGLGELSKKRPSQEDQSLEKGSGEAGPEKRPGASNLGGRTDSETSSQDKRSAEPETTPKEQENASQTSPEIGNQEISKPQFSGKNFGARQAALQAGEEESKSAEGKERGGEGKSKEVGRTAGGGEPSKVQNEKQAANQLRQQKVASKKRQEEEKKKLEESEKKKAKDKVKKEVAKKILKLIWPYLLAGIGILLGITLFFIMAYAILMNYGGAIRTAFKLVALGIGVINPFAGVMAYGIGAAAGL